MCKITMKIILQKNVDVINFIYLANSLKPKCLIFLTSIQKLKCWKIDLWWIDRIR